MSGERSAETFGADCIQNRFVFDSAPSRQPMGEDCLYLNVWIPLHKDSAVPVMVWIHGGAFVTGTGSSSTYDGSGLARQGVVVVTFNYRLGRFGFFAHPMLAQEHPNEPLGNYGIMDQIAALKWIQKNIAAFGGDPENVTVFGESAGGASILALIGSPLAQGLFHRAIVESGGGRDVRPKLQDDMPDHPSAMSAGVAFADTQHVSQDDAAALRAIPAAAVRGDLGILNNRTQATYSGPMIDGRIILDNPASTFASGKQNKVSLLIGVNSNELGALPFSGGWRQEILGKFGSRAEGLRRAYDPQDGEKMLKTFLLSDVLFVEPARFIARAQTATGATVWLYQFGYVAEQKRLWQQFAPHASELPYVFGTLNSQMIATERDRRMSTSINGYWVSFARTGNPNGGNRPNWPTYRPLDDPRLCFTNQGPLATSNLDRERLDYIADSYPQ